MNLTLESVGVVCLWLVLLLRLPAVARHRGQRALWLAVALIGLLTTLYMQVVQETLARLAGKYVVYLGTHVVSVASAAATLYFLLLANGSRRHARWLHGSTVITIVALVWIYAAASPANPSPGHSPALPFGYFLLISLFSVAALALSAVVCALSAHRADHWSLRWSLLLLATGWLCNAVPWLLNLAWLTTGDESWIAWFAQVDGVSALCMAAGSALPAVPALWNLAADLRAHRQLRPLWSDLTRDAPEVVLDQCGRPIGSVRWRLERRLAEIRDAMLSLGNYVGPGEVDAIRDQVRERTPEHREADITACWLRLAQRHRRQGVEPRAHRIDLSDTGDTRAQEIRYLLGVARAYHSPLAASYATKTGACS